MENDPDETAEKPTQKKQKRKHLTFEMKRDMFTMLLMNSTDGKLNHRRVCPDIALKYGCSVDVVERIWQEGKKIDASNPVDLNSFIERLKRKKSKSNEPIPFEENLFKAIPRHKRRSFCSIAYELQGRSDNKLKGHSNPAFNEK